MPRLDKLMPEAIADPVDRAFDATPEAQRSLFVCKPGNETSLATLPGKSRQEAASFQMKRARAINISCTQVIYFVQEHC